MAFGLRPSPRLRAGWPDVQSPVPGAAPASPRQAGSEHGAPGTVPSLPKRSRAQRTGGRAGGLDARADARDLLAREVGYIRKPHGGRLRVALAFPNTYFVGMSNLGLQTVYRLFNADERVVCERVFLPAKQEIAALSARREPLVTIESQTPVRDFDVLAFSVSFEWDYTNVVTMMRLAGVEPLAADRHPRDPLIVIGGAVTFVNPEPLAPFADVIAAGEAELLVPSLVEAFESAGSADRESLLTHLAGARGMYIPSLYDVTYDGPGRVAAITPRPGSGAPPVVQKAAVRGRRSARSAEHQHLHAGHGVRIPPADRSRARLRQPLPVLLGRLQLPARPPVFDRAHPRHRRGRQAARDARRTRLDCALRSPGHRADSRASRRDGLRHQSGVIATRRSDRAHRPAPASERRALDHDRARNRLRPPAPRDQQDRHERGHPRSGRPHLPLRDRKPEALLHARPPHGNRRRPGGDSGFDDGDSGTHARAWPRARRRRADRRVRESPRAQTRHDLPVAADDRRARHRGQE